MAAEKLYERSSRECSLLSMTPELADAIKAWAAGEDRTSLLADEVCACETQSRRKKRRLLDRMMGVAKEQLSGMLLTGTWLIWATKMGAEAPYTIGVRLADVEVSDYGASPDYTLVQDHGVHIFGFIGHAPQRGTIFLGLGDDPDGRAFKEKLLARWHAERRSER